MTIEICNLHAEALFVSNLQPSQNPHFGIVEAYVHCALIQYDESTIAALVAQEFGDHPQAACERMRWCRDAVKAAFQPAQV